MRLRDKVAVITGGTSGIGEATALLLAREGAKVVITGRNEERGREVVNKIASAGGEAKFVQADVRLKTASAQSMKRFIPTDVSTSCLTTLVSSTPTTLLIAPKKSGTCKSTST
jgi:NAD(P)-dependent dehydrogenase (short-subunit alcohol dehydrogenase family)